MRTLICILHPTNNGSQETIFPNYHQISFDNYINCIRFSKKTKIILQSCDFSHSLYKIFFFKNLEFTPCKAEQLLRGVELQDKESQKD